MAELEVKNKSAFTMKDLHCKKIEMLTNLENGEPEKMTIDFTRKIDYLNDKKTTAEVSLGINIKTDNNYITAEILMSAIFDMEEISNESMIKSLFERNAISILFPYLRSQVSLVTTQPGINPIIIPPINISKMFELED